MVWLCMVGTLGRKFCGKTTGVGEPWVFKIYKVWRATQTIKIWREKITKTWTNSSGSSRQPSCAQSATKRQGTVVDHSVPCAGYQYGTSTTACPTQGVLGTRIATQNERIPKNLFWGLYGVVMGFVGLSIFALSGTTTRKPLRSNP